MSGRAAGVLVMVVVLAASAIAGARPKIVPLTADQQTVVAKVLDDAFPLRRHGGAPLVLCLDVRVSDDPLEDATPARDGKRKKGRAPEAELPVIRGAPAELVARVSRPWRLVSSALACRLDPREAYTLDDAQRTPARLVTVRLTAHVATGALRVDWTGGTATPPGAVSSRDCTATHGPRGWAVRCGGTWSE